MTDDMGELNKDKTVGKSWCTPELIVIVRSKTEEAVLYACKVADGPPAAAGAEEAACHVYVGCYACTTVAAS